MNERTHVPWIGPDEIPTFSLTDHFLLSMDQSIYLTQFFSVNLRIKRSLKLEISGFMIYYWAQLDWGCG